MINLYETKGWNLIGAQEEVWRRVIDKECLLISSPTGSGKTEAVLYPSLYEDHRLIIVYPTKALIEDQIGRCEEDFLLMMKNGVKKHFIVDTGDISALFHPPKFKPEKRGKHLYNADLILTTFDKFIYRFFGFGWARWSYIYPYKLSFYGKPIIVFDEAHIYDTVAFENFVGLVESLVKHGTQILVMSATLPTKLQKKFNFRLIKPKVRVEKGQKRFHWGDVEKKELTKRILEIFKQEYNEKDKAIIVLNTVKRCIDIYNKLKENGYAPFIYHGRMLSLRRQNDYKELKKRDSMKEPYVLVATHAIEVGCDLNSTLMITEFCNPDSLIQRAGRCARRKGTKGRLFIVGDEVPAHLRADMYDYNRFREILEQKDGSEWDESLENELVSETIIATSRLGSSAERLTKALFSGLYDYVYKGEVANDLLYQKGVVITRSWMPSVPIIYIHEEQWKDKDTEDWVNENSESENVTRIQFPINILWRSKEVPPLYSLYVRYGEGEKWFRIEDVAPTSLNLYLVDLCVLCRASPNEIEKINERGVEIPPHIFEQFKSWQEELGERKRLWYLEESMNKLYKCYLSTVETGTD